MGTAYSRLAGICVCSAMTSESKPRSSTARASDTVSMLSSLTNVEIPNFIAILILSVTPGTYARCSEPIPRCLGTYTV